MSESLGKKFEAKFLQDWKKSFPNTFVLRLHDQVSGFKTVSQNPCDFIAFADKHGWLLECKETKENTFNFNKLTQYELMLSFADLKDIRAFVIIWFSTHDKVLAVPIKSIKAMKDANFKSVNVKTTDFIMYNIIEIPSTKKRVFMDSDYSCLKNLKDGE